MAAVVADPRVLDRIAVIGASVSAGFSAPPVATLLHAAASSSTITDAADLWTFRDPDTRGGAQIDRAIAARPTLVLAIDFLFWFAYQHGDASTRLASLERGLALLARLDVASALAIGDLPDMRNADPRMLSPEAVPPPAQLAAFNARVHAWAAARPRTIVLPLAAWTAPLLAGADVELSPGETIAADRLLFVDHQHPNPLGLWFLLVQIDRALEAGLGAPSAGLVFARP